MARLVTLVTIAALAVSPTAFAFKKAAEPKAEAPTPAAAPAPEQPAPATPTVKEPEQVNIVVA